MIFVDRVTAKPGRVKITPESGSAYYAVVERADEPVQEGTALSAENLNTLLPKPGSASVGQIVRVSKLNDDGTVAEVEAISTLGLENGGTGATTAEAARTNLGAAPAGYGLGTSTSKIISSVAGLDEAVENGWYSYECPGTTINGIYFNYGFLLVSNRRTFDAIYQELHITNMKRILWRIRRDSVEWSDWYEYVTTYNIGEQTAKTISDTLPISNGGTGATTVADALANLGLTDLVASGAKIATGSYAGTGNTVTVTLNFTPKFVIVMGDGDYDIVGLCIAPKWTAYAEDGDNVSTIASYITTGTNYFQMNNVRFYDYGTNYYYVAIG